MDDPVLASYAQHLAYIRKQLERNPDNEVLKNQERHYIDLIVKYSQIVGQRMRGDVQPPVVPTETKQTDLEYDDWKE